MKQSRVTKAVSFLLVGVLAVSTMVGCGGKAAEESTSSSVSTGQNTTASDSKGSKEVIQVKVVMPGDTNNRLNEFLTGEYAQKVSQDTNVKLQFSYIPWGQYNDKIKLMLSSSQPFDMFWSAMGDVTAHVTKKEVMDITAVLDQYGSNLKKMIPEKNFSATTTDGKVYAVPSSYGPAAEKFNSVMVRQDILEKVGMSDIKSVANLEAYAEKAKAQYPDMEVATFFPYDLPAEFMRELLDGSFSSLTEMFYVDENTSDAKIYDIDELGLLKKVNDITKKWKQKGWIPEEAFVKYQDGIGRMDSGKYLMTEGAVSRPMENALSLQKNVPDGKYSEYLLSPEKPKYIKTPGNEALMIPAYSKSAEGVIKWLDWIYADQANYDLTVLGVEGKDYKIENGKYVALQNNQLIYEWMFRNINYMKYPSYVSDTFVNSFKEWDKDAKYSKVFGFNMNGEPVKAELAKLDTVNKETLFPIILGYADYDKYIGKLKDGWKAAGMDKVKAEYEKQLTAYLAKK